MKKNLLLLLLAFFGVVSAAAQLPFTIDVDKAANVKAYTADRWSGTEDVFTLVDGVNNLDFNPSNNPLIIAPANGAVIVSVTANGDEIFASGDGIYRVGITAADAAVVIRTSGGGGAPVQKTQTLYFSVSPLNSIYFIPEGGEKTVVDKYDFTVPEGKVTIGPEAGYRITALTHAYGGEVIDNNDGTFEVLVNDYTYLYVTVAEIGVDFNVDVNVASNVKIEALYAGDVLRTLSLNGTGPYTGVAPTIDGADAQALQFTAVEGGEIKSIKRIEADGAETELVYSTYVGWRSAVAQGDTFVIEAVGPETEVLFYSSSTDYNLDSFVVTVAGEIVELQGQSSKVKVHLGDLVEVTGAKGWKLSRNVFSTGTRPVLTEGPTQSFIVTSSAAAVYLYAAELTTAQFYIDNAKAVVVKGAAGYGDEITIAQNGMNELSNVDNPLYIAAAEGFAITSVVLNGKAVSPKADGTYNVVLEAGSTVVVATKELPKALPISIIINGEADGITIFHEGTEVPVEDGMATVMSLPTEYIDIDVKIGYRITNFRSPLNQFAIDEETGAYKVTVAAAGTITVDVEKWVAAEGNVLLTYLPENNYIVAQIFSADGEFKFKPVADRMCEVAKGDALRLSLYTSGYYFKSIKLNGTAIELEPKSRKVDVAIDEDVVVEVETYRMGHVTVWHSSDPVNHTIIGQLWINEEGVTGLDVPVGETVTIISQPAQGYKMNGFSYVYPETFTAPAEAPYTFTMTDELVEDGVILQGNFVVDDEKPTYVVSGNTTLYFIEEEQDRVEAARLYVSKTPGLTNVNDMLTEVRAAEGEEVYLYAFVRDDFRLDYYSMFYHPEIHVTNPYIVKAEDVSTASGRIELAAQVSYLSGLEGVIADGKLSYNRTADVLYAPTDVQIYTLSGALVLSAEAGEVSLAELPAGLYVARSANSTLKIAK